MPSLYVLGYANVDVIARVAQLPADGERVTSQSIKLHPGGMAANCACAAAQLGTTTYLLASIGRDPLAPVLLDDLSARGVRPTYLHRSDKTTLALITVTPDGQRTIVSEPVAYHPDAVERALAEAIPAGSWLYVDGYHLGWAKPQIDAASARGVKVYVDLDGAPDTYDAAEVAEALQVVDVAQWNESVAASLLPETDARHRLAWLASKVDTVLATRGADGVDVTRGGDTDHVEVPLVRDVRDTTGAGDIFAGGVLHGLVSGHGLQHAVEEAARLASVSVRFDGARLTIER